MSKKRKWLKAFLLLSLAFIPVPPKEIEDLLWIMNETKVEFTIPDEEGDKGDGRGPLVEIDPARGQYVAISAEGEGGMSESFETIVPWGRSFGEYVRMFNLTDADLGSRILDCAGGPASFNAEMHRRGHTVVSCDPIYQFSAAGISQRIDETLLSILKMTEENCTTFVWKDIESPEHLGKLRMAAMKQFLNDFPEGIAQGRYRVGELPRLPFRDREFEIALCSHFLFTYSDALTLDFHIGSIQELCRVADEVRIFPLVASFSVGRSRHLRSVVRQLSDEGYECEIKSVPYEFQQGGNEMLCVSSLEA